ncbi:hypothetical protein [Aeromonas hydrophila]|uniref:fimbrial protein n=1 Tax=Aeromonas hydrophila TaxID=644 RepID=UPI0030DD1047
MPTSLEMRAFNVILLIPPSLKMEVFNVFFISKNIDGEIYGYLLRMKIGLIFISIFPIMALAANDRTVTINVSGVVEAPTCSLIESEHGNYEYDFGRIPLSHLSEMLDGTRVNGSYTVDRNIQFKCDGAASFVNFQFKPTSRKICPSGTKKATWNYFCNEVEGGSTLGVAYLFTWVDKNKSEKVEYLYSDRNFDSVESGIIENGVFNLNLKHFYWAPYKNGIQVLPGESKYTMGITVWTQ